MFLKSLWKPWSGDPNKPPEKDEHMMVTDSLMLELEYHCRELERIKREQEQQENRLKTGVDYSWLISSPVKPFEIPQLERLQLEELCYRVKPAECGKIISMFRDSILNEPEVGDIPRILKACVCQVLDQRPKEESLTERLAKRTVSLASLKFRQPSKITPFIADGDDIESQMTDLDWSRASSATSSVSMTTKSQSLPSLSKEQKTVHLPM